ncbi:MAG: sigma-54-dependent Fis family transcriptional regulator [Desulfuromonadaceae bacterium]
MNSLASEQRNNIRKAREDFLATGVIPEGLVDETIVRSWKRSWKRGIGLELGKARCISPHDLMRRREMNHTFLLRSQPVMENLYQEICGTSSMVLLADSDGVILHSIGDPDFVKQARQVCLKPGGIWSEVVSGTNAIGTALEERKAVHVHSSEHFIDKNQFLSCSATPIFDPRGAILGALNVSGHYGYHQRHTMALVRLSAQIIENQMFAQDFPNDIIICFHLKPEFIGSLYEGIAVFSPQGEFIAANRQALQQFELDRFTMAEHSFSSLFRLSLPKLLAQNQFQQRPVLKLQLGSGVEIYARIWPGSTFSPPTSRPGDLSCLKPEKKLEKAAPNEFSLQVLELGDRKMKALVNKALKVIGHDIPIMIEGDSGTGKELLAQALHAAGPRKSGPFVPVNCAAIPEGLIESELFGYQEGAFTGARQKGHVGKIREADQGTLFLDEIGEMPLQLQARLLRVLQDRLVSPLGGTGSLRVDFSVICATNRRIRDEVGSGAFREDLYYRLNGLLLTLPSLKDREDRIKLARNILDELAGDSQVTLSSEVLRLFENHPWPGNLRQLYNVLRTALALLGDGQEITLDELSEDFIEQAKNNPLKESADPVADLIAEPETANGGGNALLADAEAKIIFATLEQTGGNIAAAARIMGIGRNTLYRKLRGLGFSNS